MVDMMNLPQPTLMTFDGDPLSYHMFIRSFEASIGAANIPVASKLNRLLELCTGKARSAIKSCAVSTDPITAYARALRLLQHRFGDDFTISEAMVMQMVNGAAIKQDDANSIQMFTDDVRNCVETLKSMKRLSEVDTRSRLVQLVRRLPTTLQARWRKKAIRYKDDFEVYPNIEVFLEFLDEICNELSDPVFGLVSQTPPVPTTRVDLHSCIYFTGLV